MLFSTAHATALVYHLLLPTSVNLSVELTQDIIAENARIAQDQTAYQERYHTMAERYDTVKARYDEVVATISARDAQSQRLADFIQGLKAQEGVLMEFDSNLWGCLVDHVTVGREKEIVVTFRDGTEIQV